MKIWLDRELELSLALEQLTDDKIESGDFCHQTVIDLRDACRKLKAELDAAVNYHSYYRSEIDKALGQYTFDGDILSSHLAQIRKLKGEKSADKFKVGEKCLHVVGMPGPDVDDCEIIDDIGDGIYRIRYQVYDQGSFFEKYAYSRKPGEVTAIGTLIKTVKD
jgi:hypothetical protein